ncbi:unnamed protein product [Citrullus colocynthis]|uniref:Secreted protein n=1 Tax=Citrullus colocynthis TaxID=252529 RepID=A0ABP0YJU6_9ROSI
MGAVAAAANCLCFFSLCCAHTLVRLPEVAADCAEAFLASLSSSSIFGFSL